MARGGKRSGAGRPVGSVKVVRVRVDVESAVLAAARLYVAKNPALDLSHRRFLLEDVLEYMLFDTINKYKPLAFDRPAAEHLEKDDPVVARWLRECEL